MDEHCDSCGQKDHCHEVYAKLGHSKGPNMAFRAVAAFVVPVVVFIAAALLSQNLLKNKIENASLMVLIQLAAGLAAAGFIVFIIRQFHRQDVCEHKNSPEKEYP